MKEIFKKKIFKDKATNHSLIKEENKNNMNQNLYDIINLNNFFDFQELFKLNCSKIKNKKLKNYFDSINCIKKKKKKTKNNISKIKEDNRQNYYLIEEKKYPLIELNIKNQLVQKIKNNWVNKNDYINLYKMIEINFEDNNAKEVLNYSKKIIKID